MASQTTNYKLHKIDLTDAPPDITVLNPNFDTIDKELKALDDKVATKVDGEHTHDDRYYTESEIDNKLKGVIEKVNDCFKPKGNLTGSANNFVKNGVGRDTGGMTELPSVFGNIITFNSDTGDGCYLTQLYANNNYLGYRFGTDNNLNGSDWKEIATTSSTVANADTVDGKHASDFLQTTGGTVSGDVTVTQSLSAHKLQLTDYGSPLECGKYLDFHDVGSSNPDYDGRLYVHGAHLAYANGTGVTMVITEEINNLNSKVAAMEKKLGGDYMGKDMVLLTKQVLSLNVPFTYTNSKGGILRVGTPHSGTTITITVDGSVMSSGRPFSDISNIISYTDGYYGHELIIPFNSSVSLTPTSSGITIYPVAYVNK